ncbi:UvrB/UvrC motif-containing protein [Lachnospiraceae bacterium 62-35]
MLCEKCKVREATIQYTEVVNGVRTEHNFCSQCARELDFGQYSTIFDSDFPLGKLLSSLLGVGGSSEEERMNQVICPSCKTSYGEFVKNSRFGCPDCYEVFDLLISEKIKQLQGSNSHKGKKPKYSPFMQYEPFVKREGKEEKESQKAPKEESLAEVSRAAQIAVLDRERRAAVEREDYDRAAKLRDRIRELKAEEDADA